MAPQSIILFAGQFKHKIFRKTSNVPFYLTFKLFGFHVVQFSQVMVKHHLIMPNFGRIEMVFGEMREDFSHYCWK